MRSAKPNASCSMGEEWLRASVQTELRSSHSRAMWRQGHDQSTVSASQSVTRHRQLSFEAACLTNR
ncbi:hypothetical protein BAUCODRAFT_30711 [Baudoinia panamericana UAMH 10762]|uniref:Uncharacterized protein n=1 Tax=Baudoinia panamericana (strain UAMH 10762) TaxID=717646 RepID=M2NM41_BAUPA|nr:uncharacterized protein BAUCODRAFT_30711 [Baudoinia panamericana UAMH 10762]EMD00241.1 hypothetical protein BAUCODRAFT_30711 [Baudoinia panamericana UAMH 10762]